MVLIRAYFDWGNGCLVGVHVPSLKHAREGFWVDRRGVYVPPIGEINQKIGVENYHRLVAPSSIRMVSITP